MRTPDKWLVKFLALGDGWFVANYAYWIDKDEDGVEYSGNFVQEYLHPGGKVKDYTYYFDSKEEAEQELARFLSSKEPPE